MAKMNCSHAIGCRPGERVVFNALRRNLPDDYFVWFEPTVHGKEQDAYPDFVVMGPDIGVVVIEVKDWDTKGIHSANPDTFEIFIGSHIDKRTNPAKQARFHSLSLKEHIERYRSKEPAKYALLLQKQGEYKGGLAMPFYALVAFPNITHTAWQSSELQLYRVLNEKLTILRDDLEGALLERLRSARPFKPNLSHEQLKMLKWMLYPEIRVPPRPRQEELPIILNPVQIPPIKDPFLPLQAQQVAKNPQVKLVRGVVGSGKSLILLYRAKFISKQNPNWRVLVLTYNKSLMNYLRQVFKEIDGDPDRVEIVNFHKWCRDLLAPHGLFRNPQDEAGQKGIITNILREVGVTEFDSEFLVDEFNWIKEHLKYTNWDDYPDSQKVKRTGRGHSLGRYEQRKRQVIYNLFGRYQAHLARNNMCDWADIPVKVFQAVVEGIIERTQYHAILIDEAQDFAPSWFRVVSSMVKPETNILFIVGDGAQRIYRRDFTWKELGLSVTSQNSYVLRRSYRSTREIVDVALEVIRDSQTLMAELESTGDSLVEPEKEYAECRHGPLPMLLSFESPEKEYAQVAGEIMSLLQQGYLPQEIVILQRHRGKNETVAKELRKRGIPCTIAKSDLDVTEPVVKICTLHSAKGLEFEIVFICGLEEFKLNEPVDIQSEEFQQLLDLERKLLYVGMTRARERLYITYSGVGPEWIMKRLQQKLKEMQPR